LNFAMLYVISAMLFLLPCFLLGTTWHRVVRNDAEAIQPRWRTHSLRASFFIAAIATLLSMSFFVSFFYNGGDPHGMGPSPGLWKILGPASSYSIITSFLLALLGKGKGRIRLVGWAVAIVVVEAMIFVLGMD
jgi:O-antigen/teichoic acid export membrane protein